MTFFTTEEMIDLIEMKGEEIQLCIPGEKTAGNAAYGIPTTTRSVCRPVLGYSLYKSRTEIAIANAKLSLAGKGGHTVYLLAKNATRTIGVSQEDLNVPGAELIVEGTAYQFGIRQALRDSGQIQLFEIQLNETS